MFFFPKIHKKIILKKTKKKIFFFIRTTILFFFPKTKTKRNICYSFCLLRKYHKLIFLLSSSIGRSLTRVRWVFFPQATIQVVCLPIKGFFFPYFSKSTPNQTSTCHEIICLKIVRNMCLIPVETQGNVSPFCMFMVILHLVDRTFQATYTQCCKIMVSPNKSNK